MNVMYGIVATVVVLGLLLAVFMIAYNVYTQLKEDNEFDKRYKEEQKRKGK